MEYFGQCKLTSNITYADFLNFSPCPPPWLNYREFRYHALNQKLCMHEVCNLATRCGLTGSDIDCSLPSTTVTTDDLSSIVTGNLSASTSSSTYQTSSTVRTSFSTMSSSNYTPFANVNNDNGIKIMLSVVGPILAVIIMAILGISLYKKIRKRAYTTNSKHTVKDTHKTSKDNLELQYYSFIKESSVENSGVANLEQNLQNIAATTP